jgi:hypothetical protein
MKVLFLILLTPLISSAQVSSSQPAPGIPTLPARAILNVISDCGAKADGVTDDAKAINECFKSHQGRTIFFPAGAYFAASNIIQIGYGTIARGEGMPSSNSAITGAVIKFSRGAGWKIGTQDSRKGDCQNCVLEDIGIVGPAPYTPRDASACIIPEKDGRGGVYGNGLATSNDLTDGVTINSNFVTVRNVLSAGFARYGFRCNGNSTKGPDGGWCDNASIENTLAWANRGSGYFVSGGDSNASEMTQTRAYFSQMWGFELYPFLGMSTFARSAHTNHITLTKPGPALPIRIISGIGNLATLVTSEPLPGVAVGNIVVLNNTKNWDGAYAVSAHDQRNTYALKSLRTVPAAETSGNVRLATCDEAWVATGIDGGGVKNNAGVGTTVELGSYNESDNGAGATGGGAARYSPRQSIVIGGDQGPGFDVADGYAPAAWLTTDTGGFEIIGGAGFRNFVDNKHLGENRITVGKGWGGREANNSLILMQDLTGPSSPNYALEWRKTVAGASPWFGLRTHLTADSPGLSNYPLLFGYGATRESCLPTETSPNCSRPKVWFPNGFEIGNSVDGARITYGQTTTGRPPDSVGNPGDWMLNAKPDSFGCAAWVKLSGGVTAWRCIPVVPERADDQQSLQTTYPAPSTSTAQATCDTTHRGQYQFIPGSPNVKDTFRVCAKDASDHYAWRLIY